MSMFSSRSVLPIDLPDWLAHLIGKHAGGTLDSRARRPRRLLTSALITGDVSTAGQPPRSAAMRAAVNTWADHAA